MYSVIKTCIEPEDVYGCAEVAVKPKNYHIVVLHVVGRGKRGGDRMRGHLAPAGIFARLSHVYTPDADLVEYDERNPCCGRNTVTHGTSPCAW